ncbi:hypothetical protein [Photobacterium damselae]|uniref:hypothetical protein n=1 Tax=Photobacterium damselae TaxID=38293 RepID=UPI00370A49D4
MNPTIKLNQDIFNALKQINSDLFSVIEIRNIIQTTPDKNKNAARLYVARKLEALTTIGILKCTGSGRSKLYSKTRYFYTANIEIIKKRELKLNNNEKSKDNIPSTIELLESEREYIEKDLANTIAELSEYKNLINRSETLQEVLQPTYQKVVEKSGSLQAKLHVWSRTISLLKAL